MTASAPTSVVLVRLLKVMVRALVPVPPLKVPIWVPLYNTAFPLTVMSPPATICSRSEVVPW